MRGMSWGRWSWRTPLILVVVGRRRGKSETLEGVLKVPELWLIKNIKDI